MARIALKMMGKSEEEHDPEGDLRVSVGVFMCVWGGGSGGCGSTSLHTLPIHLTKQTNTHKPLYIYTYKQALLASVQQQGQGPKSDETGEGECSVGTALAQVLTNKGRLQEAAAVLESLTSLQVRILGLVVWVYMIMYVFTHMRTLTTTTTAHQPLNTPPTELPRPRLDARLALRPGRGCKGRSGRV